MRTKFLALCFATFALTPAFINIVLADVLFPLPAANPGDAFSGTFTINPATPDHEPISCGVCYGGPGTQIGTMTVQLDGNTFSGNISFIQVVPGTDSAFRWFLDSSVAFNGSPLSGNSAMSMQLYGATSSTAILPLPFSSYTEGWQIEAVAFVPSIGSTSWANSS